MFNTLHPPGLHYILKIQLNGNLTIFKWFREAQKFGLFVFTYALVGWAKAMDGHARMWTKVRWKRIR